MTAYLVRHSYGASRDGRRFGPWVEGEVVDLDLADAEWVDRDSPGALALVDDELEEPVDDRFDERGPLTEDVEAEARRLHKQLTDQPEVEVEVETEKPQQRRRRGPQS